MERTFAAGRDRPRWRPARRGSSWLLAVLVACAAGAWCACEAPSKDGRRALESNASRVDVYLGCSDPAAPPVVLELESVELRSEGGELRTLELARPRLVPSELAHRLPLAGGSVPPANYTALVLRARRAELQGPDGTLELRLVARNAPPAQAPPLAPAATVAYELALRARLTRADALSLFVDWHAADSLTGGAELAPSFTLTTERPRASLGLLYVADGASGSVLAIDRGSGEVVSISSRPARNRARSRWLAIDAACSSSTRATARSTCSTCCKEASSRA